MALTGRKRKPLELNIEIYLDGDQVCALVGKDIQEGFCGFGDTPYTALQELIMDLEGHDGVRLCAK